MARLTKAEFAANVDIPSMNEIAFCYFLSRCEI